MENIDKLKSLYKKLSSSFKIRSALNLDLECSVSVTKITNGNGEFKRALVRVNGEQFCNIIDVELYSSF